MTRALVDKLVMCPGVRVASRAELDLDDGGDLTALRKQARADVVIQGALSKRASAPSP